VAFEAERTLPMEGFLTFNTYRDYDISSDGTRFLMVLPADRQTRPHKIHIVQNWFEDLKRHVPPR
jgi:hypothetical protein